MPKPLPNLPKRATEGAGLAWTIEAHRKVAVFLVMTTKGTSSREAKTFDRSETNRGFDRHNYNITNL